MKTKQEIINFIKGRYNPDKTTIEISELFDFFEISGEELIMDHINKSNTKEVQTKLVEEPKKKVEEECCSVCGITKEEYNFNFELNEKNETVCWNCWGKNMKC